MTHPLHVAKLAAEAAGQVLMKFRESGVAIQQKETGQSYNLVSEADIQAEQAIGELLKKHFPDHEILGEESHEGSIDADHLWVVDPLDGTNNYLHGLPHFSVSIGYYQKGEAVCGVVYNPARGDWYEAERGNGATENGIPISVGSEQQMRDSLIGTGFYYDRGKMMKSTLAAIEDCFAKDIHGIRRFGSAALDIAMVATGNFAAFFEYELSPWDFAAGRLIVEEAGGRVTTCTGDKLGLTKDSVLVSNNHIHDEILQIVSSHHPS